MPYSAPTRQGAQDVSARQRWMSVLARADCAVLEEAWSGLAERPDFAHLRRPETGMVMVRGRAGGTGDPFNLGEMTVTRCAVRLSDGTVGHGYVAGRDSRKSELVALFDALLQDTAHRDRLEHELVSPLAATQQEKARRAAAKAGSTKVEFFTMVRGENPQ